MEGPVPFVDSPGALIPSCLPVSGLYYGMAFGFFRLAMNSSSSTSGLCSHSTELNGRCGHRHIILKSESGENAVA